jgi:simple sugar transport system ATP-binding protein
MTFLDMQAITKRFPGVIANDNVDFQVEAGEIHALVGENGAGKSTLMKILYGLEQPDSGKILLDGEPVRIPHPQAAIRLGIGMVHQHFQLLPSLTVAENVALGYEPRQGMFVRRDVMTRRVEELSNAFGLQVDPQQRVADLSVGVRQRVEILKLLYRDARLLILDEPTAVLTPQEVNALFDVIRRLVDEGHTAIFITHKLREVIAICQRATVLRRGKLIGTVTISATTPSEIARMMVGEEIESVRVTKHQAPGEVRLNVQGISADDERGLPALREIEFDVCAGEIVGLAGVEGNGQHELLEALLGLRRVSEGKIMIGGNDCTHLNPRQRREQGLAPIPEDRSAEGLSSPLSIWENLVATRYYRTPHSRRRVMNLPGIQREAQQLMARFDIRATDPGARVGTLSGGNAQKVVVARELAVRPEVLIAAQPTRGLDIAATRFVHEQLIALRDQGVAILLISADLDELFALSDRFIVLFQGRVVGALSSQEATRERLGLMMMGRAEASA